jgi:hypothetical protein
MMANHFKEAFINEIKQLRMDLVAGKITDDVNDIKELTEMIDYLLTDKNRMPAMLSLITILMARKEFVCDTVLAIVAKTKAIAQFKEEHAWKLDQAKNS